MIFFKPTTTGIIFQVFSFGLNPLRYLGTFNLTFNLYQSFWSNKVRFAHDVFRHHHYHMHHYLGLEFPRICKLLGVTLLIGRVFHIGQLKQIFRVDLKKLLNWKSPVLKSGVPKFCRNDELSSTMSWVGCLLMDSLIPDIVHVPL